MSYLTEADIADSYTMFRRITQAATEEGVDNSDAWTSENRRKWAASPGWGAAWEYAKNTHPNEPDYDPGADEAVITDGMILSQVQTMIEEAAPRTP